MTKIEELEQKLEVLAKELTALKEESKETPWKPKGGNWYISCYGNVINCIQQIALDLFGISFQTKKEAEEASKAFRRYHLLYQLVLELNDRWKPDWNDTTQAKWSIWYEVPSNIPKITNWFFHYDPAIAYFKDEETAKKVLEIIKTWD